MSAKTSTQPGRRTPLSLSGTVTKGQPMKGGNGPNSSGGNANGQSAANNNKQDNKQQQQKTEQQSSVSQASETKENPNKKQQQAEKKHHHQNDNKKSGSEKSQNGVNNKQQQHNKEKQHHNGNDGGKLSEKDKKEKSEKQDKPEKEEPKTKEVKKDQEKVETKKEDKKVKENKDIKEDNKEVIVEKENKTDEKPEKVKQAEKTVEVETKSTADPTENKINEPNQDEKVEKMELQVTEEEQQQQQKSPPVTPKSHNTSRASKTSTPSNKTPIKAAEKTPTKLVTPSKSTRTTPIVTREVTTAIDVDVEMEPLAVEQSPIKSSQMAELANTNIAPSATSTPGKIILPDRRNTAAYKSDVQLAMLTGLSPERPKTFSHISGRKSIRPISEYTPSQFQSNSQFRESYRRINTELDATNTSLNVTVGSEVPNNSSFSFFGRGRKRDRTPPQHSQSAIGELQTEMEISPPKRARYDMQGFFNAVSSPLSLLRNRFSKATLQSSTPVKLEDKLMSAEDEIEVQNVSGVSIHEEINNTEKDSENTTTNSGEDDATLGVEAEENQAKKKDDVDVAPEKGELELEDKEFKDESLKIEKSCAMESEQSDIKITETPLHPAVGDPLAKNKRCVVM